jgi:hypothetical protein
MNKPFENFVRGISRSRIKGLPIPRAPPRSPKKNDGPSPSPSSYFPSLNEMDCDVDQSDKDSKKTVTSVRLKCTIALIDYQICVFRRNFKIPKSGFGLVTKVENKFLLINDE